MRAVHEVVAILVGVVSIVSISIGLYRKWRSRGRIVIPTSEDIRQYGGGDAKDAGK